MPSLEALSVRFDEEKWRELEDENSRKDIVAVIEVQNLFRSLGLQIDNTGKVIDEIYLKQLDERIKHFETLEINTLKDHHLDIDRFFDGIDKEYSVDT